MIRVEHLSKKYETITALRDVNAEIAQGEVISLIGPSGCGKSTFLRCLNLLEKPTGGRIFINGINLLDKHTNVPRLRQKMGMVFQSFNLFAHLSVLDNLTLGPTRLLGRTQDQARKKAMDLLKMVGLADRVDHFPDELSGGQKQRVAIARCLAMEPEIVLFDEPTSALDPTMVSEVLAVIRRLTKEGMTMAIVTHEMDFARDVSSRVFYMDEGIIYEEGSPRQIFDNPLKPKTRVFIQRIRSLSYHIDHPNYDLFAIQGEIDHFCEKHLIPKRTRSITLLLVEELLAVFSAGLTDHKNEIDLTLSYSEKHDWLEVMVESSGVPFNPLTEAVLPDQLSQNLIEQFSENLSYQRINDRNRLTMIVKKGQEKEER